MKIAVINGPNLNFLGIREPHIYGCETLQDLEQKLNNQKPEGVTLYFFQSNSEGALIDYLQDCHHQGIEGIIINPGALTHYSYALADGIKSIGIPTIEVHISHIHQREAFRTQSVTAAACKGSISGFGFDSYVMALHYLTTNKEKRVTK